MKALVIENFNSPFELKEVDKPVAGKGEVLVKIMASGVNPLDLKITAGMAAHAQPKLPAILGIDMAGVIEAVGEGVVNFKAGDEVYGMTGGIAGIPGSLAEYAAADADMIALKPRNISMKEAASVPLVFITAWEGLVDRANIKEGQTVLIHGGGGGIGRAAIELARAKGAKVFTTVDPSMNNVIFDYGAIPINYKRLSAEQYVKDFTSGEGFDIVFDTVGGATLDDSFRSVKHYTGHVVSALGWGTHALAPLSFRGATYSGVFTLYPLISGKGRAHHGEILKEATALIEAGKLKPFVDEKEYTMKSIDDAHRSIEKKTARGKVVVTIG